MTSIFIYVVADLLIAIKSESKAGEQLKKYDTSSAINILMIRIIVVLSRLIEYQLNSYYLLAIEVYIYAVQHQQKRNANQHQR
jgi:hypothetical protein